MPKSATSARRKNPVLTLTRHPGEGVLLKFGDIEVCVRRQSGDRLVFDAPSEIQILREELLR